MSIWEILNTAPTTNKKQIRKAYAARSREVHPEEKPEEFQILYEAYQEALLYAEETGKKEPKTAKKKTAGYGEQAPKQAKIQSEPKAEAKEQESEEERILRSYFANQPEVQEEKIALFLEHWKNVKFERLDPEVQKWWADYLQSKDFQDIQWHPKLLALLGEEMDQKLHYDYVIRLFFWEVYEFHGSEETGYSCQGDLQKLRRGLYPAYARRRQEEIQKQQEEEQRRIREKQERFWKRIGIVLAAVLITASSVFLGMKLTRGRRDTIAYMESRYPETAFSAPRKKSSSEYKACYELYSLSHPDILITVTLSYSISGHLYHEKEDYGLQLLEYYASQYGLQTGRLEEGLDYYWPYEMGTEISLLYYPDTETLGEFCETTTRMFQEQEELQQLAAVGICKEGALYPEVLVNGSVEGLDLAKEQFYRPWEMSASELEASIRESLIPYMFHFEAWNLTPEQYLEWGSAYEDTCRALERENSEKEYPEGYWYSLYLEGTEESVCEIYLPVYTVKTTIGGNVYTRMIPTGDIYHYLLAEGTTLTRAEDGSGFFAESGGQTRFFGEEPAEPLKEATQWLPPEPPAYWYDPELVQELQEQAEKLKEKQMSNDG